MIQKTNSIRISSVKQLLIAQMIQKIGVVMSAVGIVLLIAQMIQKNLNDP